jgi:ankyrin repeat protein
LVLKSGGVAQAIKNGDLSTVELLISSGSVDINACWPRAYGPPALVFDARNRQKEIVEILLHANARVDDTDMFDAH